MGTVIDIWWSEALIKFKEQEARNDQAWKELEERQRREVKELYDSFSAGCNPFRVALGDKYNRENVERLAEMVRVKRASSLRDSVDPTAQPNDGEAG